MNSVKDHKNRNLRSIRQNRLQLNRIGTRLFLGFLSMAVVATLLLWVIQAGVMRNSYLNQRIEAVRGALVQAAQQNNPDYDLISQDLGISIVIVGTDGSIPYLSQGAPMMGKIMRNMESVIAQGVDGSVHYMTGMAGMAGMTGMSGQTGSYGEVRYAYLVVATGQDRYSIAVFSLTDVDAAARIIRQQLWIVTLALLVTAVILAILLSRRLSRPIQEVTQAARNLSAGLLDIRLPVRSRDEIGQLTEALNQLSQQLQVNDRLQKELIANVSHELKSPLAVIQGYAETVRDVTWPDAQKREDQLNMIADEAARLTHIVQDILAYSRLQSGADRIKPVWFTLEPVLAQLLRRYENEAARRHLHIQLQLPAGQTESLQILFDRERMDQVLNNFLNNAINHALAETTIIIRLDNPIEQQPNRHLCRLAIINQGEQISEEEMQKIWERYYRVERINEGRPVGTGLGLAIVKSILDQHGQTYGVVSRGGQNEFWFSVVSDQGLAKPDTTNL